jgi:hypothetical protein
MIYTDVFDGSNIYPSEISYSLIALTSDSPNVSLSWPEETSSGVYYATRIIDVTSSGDGYVIVLPDARKTGTGDTVLFNNIDSHTFIVHNKSGVPVMSVASGTVWQVYLSDNSTEGGTWRVVQYGAATSQANAAALAGVGVVAVGSTLSLSTPVVAFNSSYTAGVNDRAKAFNWVGAAGSLVLPAASDVGDNWFMYVRNSGTGTLSIDPDGSTLINGSVFVSFNPGDSAIVSCDGVGFLTIGLGQDPTFSFDYVSIDVSGAGNYVLTNSELNRVSYKFVGVLTGDRDVVVPNTVQQYWVNNSTTGAYALVIKTAAGSSVPVAAGAHTIMYCDGAGVVRADTANIALPINISEGGTGAASAGAALINLGATSVGASVFTAVSQGVARTVLGSTATGDAVFVAATASAARTALGSTATGDAVFVAATASAARTALGSTVVGDAIFVAVTQEDAWDALGPADGGVF